VRDTPELRDYEERLFPQVHLFDRQRCRPWASRALTLEETGERKAQYLRDGGVLIV
jgi:hypothetical protein